jgi:hypothetical protein
MHSSSVPAEYYCRQQLKVQLIIPRFATMSSRCVHSSPLSSACMNAHVTHRSTDDVKVKENGNEVGRS